MGIKTGSKLEQIEQFLQETVGNQVSYTLRLTTHVDSATLKYVKQNQFLENL